MSVFEELKRRNVFRVGIAYLVGAWLLLQLADVLSELLSLPPEIGPVVVTVVAIGFPVVLFAAWAYELTPEGIKRESEVDRSTSITPSTGRKLNGLIIGLLSLAVLVLLADKFLLRDTGGDAAPSDAERRTAEAAIEAAAEHGRPTEAGAGPPGDEPPASAIDPRSIAVLPFTNRSPVEEDEFFIDGIHDDLLTNLARIGGFKVISRTSVARYRDTDTPIPDIARQLGVATVMEGAVQRSGDAVRINVQLIDARTDEHLWAEIYDRDLTTDNLFAIQSEIAERIAASLETELSPAESQRLNDRPTENLAAYSAYLRGMRAFERREIDAMRSALADFQRAVELDPEFAHAWAGIAQVAEVLPSWGGMRRAEGQAISIPAAERAMALAPDLGEANLALAMVETDPGKAKAKFRKALDMLPNHAMAHQWAANAHQGAPGPDWEVALTLLRKAAELDPVSPNHRSQVARQLLFMNRHEEAERELRVVLESNPEYVPVNGFLAWAASQRGDLDESVRWEERYIELDPGSGFPRFELVLDLTHLRDRERLQATRDAWADEGVPKQFILIADMMLATMDGRFEAIPEIVGNSTLGPPGTNPGRAQAMAYTYLRDYRAALAAWQTFAPELFTETSDPAERRAAIGQYRGINCLIADVAARAGQPEWGRDLARETIVFAEQYLDRYVEHAPWEASLAYCHAMLGDHEAALAQLEDNLRQRHFPFWWEVRLLEMFDPLRGDARFEDLMQAFEDEMARQRASLDRLEAQEAAGV